VQSPGYPTPPLFYVTPTGTNYYFGGKLIKNGNGNNWVYADRLGSVGKYYPYGQDKGSSNPSSGEKFTGYFRDAETGNDYAVNRYVTPSSGRFMTPDPSGARASSPASPQSWNMYAYALGDPINYRDPRGLEIASLGEDDAEGGDGCTDDDFFCASTSSYYGYSGPGGCVSVSSLTPQPDPWCGGGPVITDPTLPTQSQPPPCWTNLGNISATLNELGENIEEIAATAISSATELAALTGLVNGDISAEYVQLEADVLNGVKPTGPDYAGGHFNLIIQTGDLKSLLGAGYSSFAGLFGGFIDGTRQAAVYGNAAQGNYTLHSKQHFGGYYGFHFDIYNPLTDVVSTVAHLYGDVIGGHNGTPCLDPAWQ
jgi:RHS repeat-associated protein